MFRICAILFLNITLSATAETVVFDEKSDFLLIGKNLSYCTTNDELTPTEVLAQKDWIQGQEKVLNFGSTKEIVWLKFSIRNYTNKRLYLVLNMPYLDYFELINTKDYSNKIVGDNMPFSQRTVKTSILAHELKTGNGTEEYLIKISSSQSLFLPIYVINHSSLEEINRGQDKVFGVFTGILGIILLSSLVILVIVRDIVFLYYMFYIIAVYFTQSFVIGFGFEHFFANSLIWSKHGLTFFTTFLGIWALQFIYKFLDVENIPKAFQISIRLFQIAYFIQLPLVYLGYNQEAFIYINTLFFVTDVYIILVAIWSVFYIDDKGRYFLFAWMLFIGGSILYTLNNLGLIKYSLLTNYLMPLGVIVESLTLSIILGFKIKKLVIDNGTYSKLLQRKDALIDKQDQALAIGILKSVGANLQPHFIYNILTTASQLIRSGNKMASATIIDDTARLMRQGLSLSDKTCIDLETEIEYVNEFVKVESKKRDFEVDFLIKSDLDFELSEVLIPPFITQMIVENSIKHNSKLTSKLTIECLISNLNDTHFKCVIKDDGGNLEEINPNRKKRLKKHSFGNRIMSRRLAAMKTLGYLVSISSHKYKDLNSNICGYITEIIIPLDHQPLIQHANEYV